MKLMYGDTFRFKGKKKVWKILTKNKTYVYYGSYADTLERKWFEKSVKNGKIIIIKT